MTDPVEEQAELPPVVAFIKRLVAIMAVVMIVGFVVLIVTLVTRLSVPSNVVPASIILPEGVKASAYTVGDGWYAVVTHDNQILIFNSTTGALKQTVQIEH